MRIPQQCVVTASPGVHIRCIPAKDGSIIIQTRDGSINISFRHAGSPQSTETNQRNIWSLCEPSVIEHARSRFCFTFDSLDRENTGEDDIEEVEEVGTVNLEEDVIADDDENDENVEVRVAGDDDTAAMKKAKRKKQSMSEFEVKEQCQQIRTTIGNKWKAQDTKQNLNEWSAEEFQFLGCAHFDSSAAWSYRCLIDSEKKSHLYRNPLHKWNLAKSHQERKQSSNINFDFTSRQFMLRELEPALDNLSRKERKPIYTRFERYINQGEVLILMENRYPGLLITIARFITTKQFNFLWQYRHVSYVSGLSWLDPTILEEAGDYAEFTERILDLITTHADRSRKRRRIDSAGPTECASSISSRIIHLDPLTVRDLISQRSLEFREVYFTDLLGREFITMRVTDSLKDTLLSVGKMNQDMPSTVSWEDRSLSADCYHIELFTLRNLLEQCVSSPEATRPEGSSVSVQAEEACDNTSYLIPNIGDVWWTESPYPGMLSFITIVVTSPSLRESIITAAKLIMLD